jgi:hypothetical protein
MLGAEITVPFLINKNGEEPEKVIVDWGYNAWEINILRLI